MNGDRDSSLACRPLSVETFLVDLFVAFEFLFS